MGYQLQISAKILSWPRECACCGNNANTELRAAASRTTGKRVQHTTTSWWHVPYCDRCLHHKAEWDKASKWAARGIWVGLAIGIALGWASGSIWFGFIVLSLVATLGVFCQEKARSTARKLTCETCASPSDAVRYLKWHGTFHTFVFENEDYLKNFISANSRKTMSDVRRI
jgi:hypothetical protein